MRRFKITVDGQTYEVEVEELGRDKPAVTAPAVQPRPAAIPKPPAPKPPQPPTEEKPKPAAKPAAAGGANVVSAPLPGKILAVKVTEGQQVEAGQVLCILEAMKMENEIMAPTAGVVKEIKIQPGATVNPGDALIVLG